MQLKALPGQPVCKHSVSMCFGRAPAPRARSKLQRGRRGCAPAAAPAGPPRAGPRGWGRDGRAPLPPHSRRHPLRPRSRVRRQGWGQAGCSLALSSIPSRISFATPWLLLAAPRSLRGCPGAEAGAVPQAIRCGCLSGQRSLSCLLQAGPQAGQPHPSVYFGLSAWSFWFCQPVLPLVWLIGVSQKKPGQSWLG